MKVYTIGFTQISAECFFEELKRAEVKKVLDVRLNNVSQLAGFAKKNDLRYFLNALLHIGYSHRPELAPTQEMLDRFKKHNGSWDEYERQFIELMEHRRIEETLPRDALDGACLLCSEHEPDHCHRRLVAEYLRDRWGGIEIRHLPEMKIR